MQGRPRSPGWISSPPFSGGAFTLSIHRPPLLHSLHQSVAPAPANFFPPDPLHFISPLPTLIAALHSVPRRSGVPHLQVRRGHAARGGRSAQGTLLLYFTLLYDRALYFRLFFLALCFVLREITKILMCHPFLPRFLPLHLSLFFCPFSCPSPPLFTNSPINPPTLSISHFLLPPRFSTRPLTTAKRTWRRYVCVYKYTQCVCTYILILAFVYVHLCGRFNVLLLLSYLNQPILTIPPSPMKILSL